MRRMLWTSLAVVASAAAVALAGDPAAPSAPKAHENKVSPQAKAALERYVKLTYRPTDAGLVSASGSIVIEGIDAKSPPTFTFEAPRAVRVAPPPGRIDNLLRQAIGMADTVLTGAFVGVPIPDAKEYDAELRSEDGRTVLVTPTYRDGAPQTTLRATLDAEGLPTTVVMFQGASFDPPKPGARTVTIELTWRKAGAAWRVEKMGFPSPGGNAGRMDVSLTWTDVEGVAVVTSWVIDAVRGEERRSMSFRVAELTVNGKRAELPEPPKGATAGRK